MAGVELVPAGAEPVGGAALMRLARVLGTAAPDDVGLPFLRPEIVELDPLLVDPARVLGIAVERPSAGCRFEIGEQPVGGILAGRLAGQAAGIRGRGRAGDDVADLLAVEQG